MLSAAVDHDPEPRLPSQRPWKRRLAAVAVGLLIAFVAAEILLRITLPAAQKLPGELWWFREGGAGVAGRFTVDDEMGFRPRLGTAVYGEHGALANDYDLAKVSGRERILFIGDSVTARGRIVTELHRRCAEQDIEWWNAGVESFNTRQEVDYYRRYNAGIDPDHVILTFHPNDFGSTPVAFVSDTGELVVYAPDDEGVHGFLIRYSMLYRTWFAHNGPQLPPVDERARDEVHTALAELQGLVGPDRRLSVLLLPILQPPRQWEATAEAAYRTAIEVFEDLDIRYYDLRPVLEAALANGVEVQETPGDTWHPSAAFAARAAETLLREGLLQ